MIHTRKPIVAANWKMHMTPQETDEFLRRGFGIAALAYPPEEIQHGRALHDRRGDAAGECQHERAVVAQFFRDAGGARRE